MDKSLRSVRRLSSGLKLERESLCPKHHFNSPPTTVHGVETADRVQLGFQGIPATWVTIRLAPPTHTSPFQSLEPTLNQDAASPSLTLSSEKLTRGEPRETKQEEILKGGPYLR